jgi:hypothetical protein
MPELIPRDQNGNPLLPYEQKIKIPGKAKSRANNKTTNGGTYFQYGTRIKNDKPYKPS